FDFFFFQAEDGIRVFHVTGVQTCALPISARPDQLRSCRSAASLDRAAAPFFSAPVAVARHGLCSPSHGREESTTQGGTGHPMGRSEERRVGKEWRCRWSPAV